MIRILIDKTCYTCGGIRNTLSIGNGIVRTCTISFYTDDTLICIIGLILATTSKNKQENEGYQSLYPEPIGGVNRLILIELYCFRVLLFLYSPSKVQQYFETCKKIGRKF